MLTLPTFFTDFLEKIRPTTAQKRNYRDGHKLLRDRLAADDALKTIVVADFLQGSYRRATAIRPDGTARPDVDVVVVTNLDPNTETPQQAMDRFKPFLEKHYAGKYKLNDRSYGIELSLVDLDLVITAKPDDKDLKALKSFALSEDLGLDEVMTFSLKAAGDDGWKAHPLQIPDRRLATWQPTHPLAQIQWTWDKNRSCSGHYVNVVKAIKWWRRVNHSTPKYPKGYPLEHIIGQCCPDGIDSVADGITRTLEEIASRYAGYAAIKAVPILKDHGVDHNVLHRVSGEEFAQFHGQVQEAARIARAALDETSKRRATEKWRKLFGDKFDLAEEESAESAGSISGGYSPRSDSTTIRDGRYG